METPAVRLLIQSGVIPENALRQLVKWKIFDKKVLDQTPDGSPPTSLSAGWETPDQFVDALTELIELEQDTIRETDFEVAGAFKTVWFKWGNGRFDKKERQVLVDNMGRVFVPRSMLKNGNRIVQAVSFTPNSSDLQRVISEETRFNGTEAVVTVLNLEPKDG
jgi:hypothetical protein